MEDLENVFGIWHSETLPFSKYGEGFWVKALRGFFNSNSYDQRIKFFKKYDFILDYKYHPYIGENLSNVDMGAYLTELYNSMTNTELSNLIDNDDDLMKWYLERKAFEAPFNTLTILEKWHLARCFIQFTFSVLPPYDHATASIIVFNRYYEEDILERYPEIHYMDMLHMMEIKNVPDRKRQIETIIKNIQQKIDKKAEEIYFGKFSFWDGYEKCITDGYGFVPYDKKISKDFIEGKNLAMFEIELNKSFENLINTPIMPKVKIDTTKYISQFKNNQKLKWKGKPSEFGYLIYLLIENGYLEKPTPHFTTDAKIYMELFDIKTTPKNLAREISIINNSLTPHNKKAFKIEPLK